MNRLFHASVLAFVLSSTSLAQTHDVNGFEAGLGVLVMAHGGSEEWNEGVRAAVAPLQDEYNIEVALGMADPASLQEATTKLEAQGAARIAVVRLFISGESWYERTQQILGLADGAPERPAESQHHGDGAGAEEHSMALWKIETDASFALSREGLSDATEMGAVLADRARALSQNPRQEDVLILAHGPADDLENERWLAAIDSHADKVRSSLPFHEVRVETLREDWPEKRALAEQRIHEFIGTAIAGGRQILVVPFRVHGFGPYAEVLDGNNYLADGHGLIPHPQVTEWIRRQIGLLADGLFRRP